MLIFILKALFKYEINLSSLYTTNFILSAAVIK